MIAQVASLPVIAVKTAVVVEMTVVSCKVSLFLQVINH
jgi:hypothetical protein